MKEPKKATPPPVVTAEAVQALQRRVQAFAATGTTSHAPTTYHR
ncbi:hypothetical protein ACWDG9_43285 [Streptomyces sp. NPDC001073]